MKSIITILLVIISIQINSQTRTFEFSFCGRQQKVKLYEKKGTKYNGIIENTFYKKKYNREIIRKNKIDKETVKKIINQINQLAVYEYKDNDNKIDCGDYFSIKISEGNFKFQKTYSEIYPESEKRMLEKNDCRRKAQMLATLIDNELKLKEVFNNHFKQLGDNTCYWSGFSQVCKVRKD